MKTKRLRVFAGPNGSGKSTLKQHITGQFSIPFGFFVNADNILDFGHLPPANVTIQPP